MIAWAIAVAVLLTGTLGAGRTLGAANFVMGATSTTGAWTEVGPPLEPPAMAGAMMAYDSAAHRFVLFGGWNGASALNATWLYDPGNRTWTQLHPSGSPLDRGDFMFVYDSRADVFLLFGGWHEEPNGTYIRLDDTWTFALGTDTWTERHPARSPSARSDAEVAYDPVADAVLLVGGFDGSAYLGDMWAYTPGNDTWFPRASPVQPSPRADGRMVYVNSQDRFVLFGGNDYSGPNLTFHHLADTWSYLWAANAWENLTAATGPEARDYPILAYDPAGGQVLLTSGFGNGTSLSDLWTFNLTTNAWAQLTPPISPPARFASAGGFDTSNNLLIVFGGATDTGLIGDTWHYGLAPPSEAPTAAPLLWALPVGIAAVALAAALVVLVSHRGRRNRPRQPPRST